MSDSPLAPVLEIPTSLPVPSAAGINSTSEPVEHIGLRVSSEFTTHVAPVSLVDGSHKLALVKDKNGQPMLFSLGNRNRFMCFAHERGASQAWQSYDITPEDSAGAIVTAFDVTESDLHLVLAVAISVAASHSKVFTSVCQKANFDPLDIKWAYRASGTNGPDTVTSLLCGGSDHSGHATVIAGTKASNVLSGTYYQLQITPRRDTTWTPSPFPENVDRILQVAPGRLSGNLGQGYYAVYAHHDDSVGCVYQKYDHSMKMSIPIAGRAQIRDIHSTITPYYGETDLFMATERGILYFSRYNPGAPPLVLLENIAFKQVVAAAYGSQILVFGVSDQRELYYLERNRETDTHFTHSGFPIRAGVEMLSVAYNVTAGATEVMYVETKRRTIKHLWRDPASFMWQEAPLTTLAPKGDVPKTLKTRSYPAYVTSITVVNETTGESLGAGYELAVTSDLVYVTINDNTYSLTKRQTHVKTDSSGRVTIIQEANDTLNSPVYSLHLSSSTESVEIPVHPAQRVIQQLCKYSTVESLSNAKTTDGRKVQFGAGASSNFEATASLLGQFGPLLKTIDPALGEQLVPTCDGISTSDIISLEIDAITRSVRQCIPSWLEKAVSGAVRHFGDIWESIKCGLKTAFKFAVKVAGAVAKVFISIAGKVYSFLADTVAPLLRSFAGVLKDTLGVDINGLLDWLGFNLDWENVRKTQKHLTEFGTNLLTLMSDFFVINRSVFEENITVARRVLSEYVKDTRIPLTVPGKPKEPNPLVKLLGWIFNNPIVQWILKHNPLTWLMNEAADIVGDDIRLPDISPLASIFTDLLPDLFVDQLDLLTQFGKSVVSVIIRLVAGEIDFGGAMTELLGDTFWSVFDSVTGIATTIFDALGKFFAALFNFFTQEINMPFITDTWVAFTRQPFTVMNALTLLPAFSLNTFFTVRYKKLPFDDDVLGSPSKYLPSKEQIKFPSIIDIAVNALPFRLPSDVLERAKAEIKRDLGIDITTSPRPSTAGSPQTGLKASAMTSLRASMFDISGSRLEGGSDDGRVSSVSTQSSISTQNHMPQKTFPYSSKAPALASKSMLTSQPAFSVTASQTASLQTPGLPLKVDHVTVASVIKNDKVCPLLPCGRSYSWSLGAMVGLASTSLEVQEARIHGDAAGAGGHEGPLKKLKVGKLILGGLGCCVRFGSFCVMAETPHFADSLAGKHGSEQTILSLMLFFAKIFAFAINGVEVYLSTHASDQLWNKVAVSSACSLELIGTVFTMVSAWHILGAGWGDPDVLSSYYWTQTLNWVIAPFADALVQIFFAFRIYKLTQGILIPITIFSTGTVTASSGILELVLSRTTTGGVQQLFGLTGDKFYASHVRINERHK
ncbi:hypothetical protein HGRIS_000763 [Hohenbuehelia grisea]|uniref:Uncharacterized protein n=1 Tax=Hohenbuehelia grisea TaxID=104357 RepID=A0ABR3IPM6_9AGAR